MCRSNTKMYPQQKAATSTTFGKPHSEQEGMANIELWLPASLSRNFVPCLVANRYRRAPPESLPRPSYKRSSLAYISILWEARKLQELLDRHLQHSTGITKHRPELATRPNHRNTAPRPILHKHP